MKNSVEVFPPGEFLNDELEERNWTQTEFAEIIGRPLRLINEISLGKRAITPETAIQIAEGLGTSPELWMNLESRYQLSKVRPTNNLIKTKAALHSKFPLREMSKRAWIDKSDNVDILEKQCLDFFEISAIDKPVQFAHAAKKTSYSQISMLQNAWLFMARKIAKEQIVPKYSKDFLVGSLGDLKNLMSAPEEARHVVKVLNKCGVRFVIVEAFPGSKIDGACFWLNKTEPVIAMSTRLDRIDNFWFVLRHEIEHVIQGDGNGAGGAVIDEEITKNAMDGTWPKIEVAANKAAAEFCVSKSELDHYIARVIPYYFSDKQVRGFAGKLGIHPGIVVGQLHNRFNEHKYLRACLVKIRHIVTQSTPSDGWGDIYPM